MILAFTGAGISKDSGIDTFMDRPDVRDKLFREYANVNPQDYRETIQALKRVIDNANPNDAHFALAEYDVEIITMNIDGLHEMAGSKKVLNLHGTLPSEQELPYCDRLYEKPVLYGDSAPNYEKAIYKVSQLSIGDTFLVIGASNHTAIAYQLKQLALMQDAQVIEIKADAKMRVRQTLQLLEKGIDNTTSNL